MEEQKKINAQLSQKLDTMENNVNKRIDGLQSEMEHKLDNLQCSISKLAQQLDHPEEECLSDTMVAVSAAPIIGILEYWCHYLSMGKELPNAD